MSLLFLHIYQFAFVLWLADSWCFVWQICEVVFSLSTHVVSGHQKAEWADALASHNLIITWGKHVTI